MKLKIIAIALAIGCMFAPAYGQGTAALQGHSFLGGTQATTSGLNSSNYLNGIIPHATITVYLTGTTTLATIYKDGNSTPLSNPFTSNDVGSVNPGGWIFWAAVNQGYDVIASGGIAPNTYANPVTLCADCYPGMSFTGTGLAVSTNGTPNASQSTLNFSNTTPQPPPGFINVLFQNSGGNESAYVPTGGAVGPGTLNFIPKFTPNTTALGNSACDDGATTAGYFTCSEPIASQSTHQGAWVGGTGSGTVPTPSLASWVGWIAPTSGSPNLFYQLPNSAPSGSSLMVFGVPSTVNGVSQSANTLKPLAGSGAAVPTGPNSTTPGHCVEYADSSGTLADAGAACGGGGGTYPSPVTVTASNSASLAFTTCFSSSYNDYQIRFDNVVAATSGSALLIQMSTNGGTSYDSTAANYQSSQWFNSTDTASSGTANTTTAIGLWIDDSVASTAGAGFSGVATISNVNSTSAHTSFVKSGVGTASNAHNYALMGGGFYSVTSSARNAFQVIMSSGNITSGTVTCQPLPN